MVIIDDLRRRVIVRAVGFLASVPQPATPWTAADVDVALRNAFVAEMFELWEQDATPERKQHLDAAKQKYVETFVNKSHDMGEWVDELDALHWSLVTTAPTVADPDVEAS